MRRFASVSGRFVSELSKAGTLKEGKLDLIIRCMRFLKLKVSFARYLIVLKRISIAKDLYLCICLTDLPNGRTGRYSRLSPNLRRIVSECT